jgi:hypothetical protein
LAVAALAIVLLGHRHTSSTTTVAPVRPASGPETIATLRSQLAILRRSQRASDRLPAWALAAEERPDCSNCLNLAKPIKRDTRLLTRIHVRSSSGHGKVDERIYLIVGTPSPTARWNGKPADGWQQAPRLRRAVHVSIVGFTGRVAGHSSPFDMLLNGSPQAMPARALNPRDVMIGQDVTVGVIPDGVTRVRWELANPGQQRPAIVYPKLHGNVATAPWTPAPGRPPCATSSGCSARPGTTRNDTWLPAFTRASLISTNGHERAQPRQRPRRAARGEDRGDQALAVRPVADLQHQPTRGGRLLRDVTGGS